MMKITRRLRQNCAPAIRLAVMSLLLCGLVFPLVITGFAQLIFPSQANGSLVQLHSGVDPDITVQDAQSQISRINSATGISVETLQQVVNQNEEGTFWIFGTPYVNVLKLNLALIQTNNVAYKDFQ